MDSNKDHGSNEVQAQLRRMVRVSCLLTDHILSIKAYFNTEQQRYLLSLSGVNEREFLVSASLGFMRMELEKSNLLDSSMAMLIFLVDQIDLTSHSFQYDTHLKNFNSLGMSMNSIYSALLNDESDDSPLHGKNSQQLDQLMIQCDDNHTHPIPDPDFDQFDEVLSHDCDGVASSSHPEVSRRVLHAKRVAVSSIQKPEPKKGVPNSRVSFADLTPFQHPSHDRITTMTRLLSPEVTKFMRHLTFVNNDPRSIQTGIDRRNVLHMHQNCFLCDYMSDSYYRGQKLKYKSDARFVLYMLHKYMNYTTELCIPLRDWLLTLDVPDEHRIRWQNLTSKMSDKQ